MKVILEVGPEDYPVLPSLVKSEPNQDFLYIAMEDGSNNMYFQRPAEARAFENIQPALHVIERHVLASGPKSAAMLGSAERVPMRDESVDEIVLSNVVGQYIFHRETEKIMPILRDLRRVIKKSGLITLYEAITPPDISEMASALELAGFILSAVDRSRLLLITPRTKNMKSLDRRYGKNPIDAWLCHWSVGAMRAGVLGRRFYMQAVPDAE